jgi:hypothetical protein
MVMASQEGRYYADIEEVELAFSPEQANEKLARGYELLKIETLSSVQKLGDLSAQETTRLVFVLGKRKEEERKASAQPQAEAKEEILIPQSIPWKEQTSGFAWAFAQNKNGTPIEEYKGLVERLKLSPLERDGYRYSISKDGKFLQRSKVEGKK